MMQEQLPPRDVLERVREIDPNADLLYVGGGRWMLGAYRDGEFRRAHARKQLHYLHTNKPFENEEELEPWAAYRKYLKMRDGFAPILVGEAHNGLFGELIHDFRVADWFWRNQPDSQFEKNLNGSDTTLLMEDRKHQMLDYADSEAGSVWRHTHRHPVSIVKPTRKA